ncbi:hypothetical protein AAFF_G00077440, partial [Aldrovandia affinis]
MHRSTRKSQMKMAQSRSFLCMQQFQCSICLDVFTNPASTPCGHSFCMTCIGRYWDESRVCQCPLCKETFSKRPYLHINHTLKDITEQFKGMVDQDGTADLGLPLDVSTVPGLSREQSPGRFTLSGPAASKQVPLCQKHHRQLELFCQTDETFVCVECLETDHQAHATVSTNREWLVNKSQLGTSQAEIQEMTGDRLRKVEELRTTLVGINASVIKETQGSMRVFRDLMSSMERTQAQLLEVIQMNRLAAEQQVEGMIWELEREIAQLRKRSSVFEQLLHSEDYALFLKCCPALCTPPQVKNWAGISVNPELCVGGILGALSQVSECFQEKMQRLLETSIRAPADPSPMAVQPKVKKMQDYAVAVTFDSATAHPKLILSKDKKQVRCGDRHNLAVPNNPERYDRVICVLGSEGFTGGRYYWEVEVGNKTDWDLGVASHSIQRKGKLTINPSHGYWFLSLRDSSDFNIQSEPSTAGGRKLKPRKIGVFLDYEKGQVSFYNVDAKSHIHTFTDTFSKTIYPFFSPCGNKSGKNE